MTNTSVSSEKLLSEEDGVFLYSVESDYANIAYIGEGATIEDAKADAYRTKELAEKHTEAGAGMNFGQAIESLKRGEKVARKGWNGKGMFLFLLPAGEIPKSAIHDPMLKQVLEDSGRDTFEALGSIRMKTADNKILTGWLASQTDMLAEDWVVVK